MMIMIKIVITKKKKKNNNDNYDKCIDNTDMEIIGINFYKYIFMFISPFI